MASLHCCYEVEWSLLGAADPVGATAIAEAWRGSEDWPQIVKGSLALLERRARMLGEIPADFVRIDAASAVAESGHFGFHLAFGPAASGSN